MSRRAWLTPEDAPGAAVCRPVFIPAGVVYEAAFRGAFLLLCDPENWEQHGSQTPDSCANVFYSAFLQTLDSEQVCSGGKLIGEIFIFGYFPGPPGALFCDGAIYAASLYPDLYAIIGPTYGDDGAGTFRVPDLRGRVPVGQGGGPGLTFRQAGVQGGEESHLLIEAEIPAHHHTVKRQATTGGTPALTNAISNTMTDFPTSDVGGDEPHENMPPFLAMPFFIQATNP